MNPFLFDLLEPVVVIGTLLGSAFCVKALIWGKGPIRRLKGSTDDPAIGQRLTRLEEHWDEIAELATRQADQLDELHERLDFAERLLTQQRDEPRLLENREAATPT